jgi:hypothetical protein
VPDVKGWDVLCLNLNTGGKKKSYLIAYNISYTIYLSPVKFSSRGSVGVTCHFYAKFKTFFKNIEFSKI